MRSAFAIWTNFVTNWILELDHSLNPNLHLGSPNHELSLIWALFFVVWTNLFIFPPKWCHVGLALICHFLVFDSRLEEAMGPIYGSQPIGLLYLIGQPWTLDSHLKWLVHIALHSIFRASSLVPLPNLQFQQQRWGR